MGIFGNHPAEDEAVEVDIKGEDESGAGQTEIFETASGEETFVLLSQESEDEADEIESEENEEEIDADEGMWLQKKNGSGRASQDPFESSVGCDEIGLLKMGLNKLLGSPKF